MSAEEDQPKVTEMSLCLPAEYCRYGVQQL